MLHLEVAVAAVPAAGRVVAAGVAVAVVVVLAAVSVVLGPALSLSALLLTVPPIIQTLLCITSLIAFSILEHVSTGLSVGGGVTSLPGIHSQVTVSFVKLARQLVTLRITLSVPGLLLAPVLLAHAKLDSIVHHQVSARVTRAWSDINTSRRCFIKQIAVLPLPHALTVAVIVAGLVDAASVLPAGVVHALVPVVHLARGTGCPQRTLAPVATPVSHTGAAIVTMVHCTRVISAEVTARTRIALRTLAVIS